MGFERMMPCAKGLGLSVSRAEAGVHFGGDETCNSFAINPETWPPRGAVAFWGQLLST